jgi:hypothetical protein
MAVETGGIAFIPEAPLAEPTTVYPETNVLALHALASRCGKEQLALKIAKFVGRYEFFTPYGLVVNLPYQWRGPPDWLLEAKPTLLDVIVLGERVYEVRTHRIVGRMNDYAEYGDRVALLAILLARAGRRVEAMKALETLRSMIDGYGIADKAHKVNGLYESYKLALCMLAARELAHRELEQECRQMLLSVSPPATLYTRGWKGVGDLNVETASLALLALHEPKHDGVEVVISLAMAAALLAVAAKKLKRERA